jgi:plastocyanin
MRRGRWPALLLSVGLVATACGGEETRQQADEDSIIVAGERANDQGTQNVAGLRDFELQMDEFYFRPTILTGEPGQTITLELLNDGTRPHTFTLDLLRVDLDVAPERTAGTKVTFPDSGALLFYCRFHAGGGMRGGLSVEGDLQPAEVGSGGSGGSDEPGGRYE